MKITLCGSGFFMDKILAVAGELKQAGHEIYHYPQKVKDPQGKLISLQEYYQLRKSWQGDQGWVFDHKGECLKEHAQKIAASDAVLILNYEKNDIPGYIGGSTFFEVCVAFYLDKKIFFLNHVPEVSFKEELLGMKPTVVDGDLSKVI